MRKTNALTTLNPLLRKPFFTSKEAEALGVSSAILGYYIKSQQLVRIRRGVYQSAIFQRKKRHFSESPWENFLHRLSFIPQGVVCLASALSIYHMTDKAPDQHWIAIPHTTSIREESRTKIVRFRNMELGKTKMVLGGIKVRIFDRERTIVDAFRLLGLETAIKALQVGLSQRINLKKLQDYAKRLRVDIMPYLITLTLGKLNYEPEIS